MKNLVGKFAKDFTSSAVLSDGLIVNDFNLYDNISGKYGLLFFYPMDFTFVCPSELIALNNRLQDFKKRNVVIIGISVDSHFVHKAWRNTSIELGGIGDDIGYTLVSDVKRSIIKSYCVEDEVSGVAYRGSFVIDTDKIIRVQHVNDFAIGRNIDEYIRLFDALDFHMKNGNVCQAGWVKGSDGIMPSLKGVSNFLASNAKKL